MNMDEKTITKDRMEKYIRWALEDICRDYLKYNPTGDYLTMNIFIGDGHIIFHANDCEENRLDFTSRIEVDDL